MDSNVTAPTPPPAIPTSEPMAPVTAAFIILGVTIGAILLHLVLTFIFTRLARKTIWQFDDDIVKFCKRPTFVIFPVVALLITIQLMTLPVGVFGTLNHVLIIILLFAISYFVVMLIKCGSLAVGRINSHLKSSEPKRAREVETQIVNALASLTIALTQPFLLEDQVQVAGEVGHIEEIQSQYVIVRTMDERRLVIPLTWFLGNIFQNWSRNSCQQIGECKIFIDYTVSIPRIRQAFLKFARSHPLYDGRHVALLVTDCSSTTIQLTCQVSVKNAMDVLQVTSDVREALVEYLAKNTKGMAGSLSGSMSAAVGAALQDMHVPITPPLPLTKEDEKMGQGSKLYASHSLNHGQALGPSGGHVNVVLEDPHKTTADAVVSVGMSEPSLGEK
ncbi:hypothetical protein BGZ81_011374 [Podila clonocystis]|nr:hypothetical protein BGZ81_011374 [Podila clonocystis]